MATSNAEETKPPSADTRFCYGASCTWFGPIQDVSSTDKYQVKAKEEHFPKLMADASLPCCPCCGGMLFELPDELDFWNSINAFELGAYPRSVAGTYPRRHPGYRVMWEWQRDQKTCFPRTEALAEAYKTATGIAVDIEP